MEMSPLPSTSFKTRGDWTAPAVTYLLGVFPHMLTHSLLAPSVHRTLSLGSASRRAWLMGRGRLVQMIIKVYQGNSPDSLNFIKPMEKR